MAILSFKKRFAGKVRNGRKRQTIRGFRKYPIKAGETLYLYTALRTKYAEKLRVVTCKSTEIIHIFFNNSKQIILPEHEQTMDTDAELNAFAKADGFKDFEDMRAFWIAEHGVKKGKRKVILRPFTGTLIKW